MAEAFVRLLCPECSKAWGSSPRRLPPPAEQFRCPDCETTRPVAEFMRTERDLETLKQLH